MSLPRPEDRVAEHRDEQLPVRHEAVDGGMAEGVRSRPMASSLVVALPTTLASIAS